MENGQKVIIPLDSELDVKSSDMLVNIEQPKFQHNRQKYQGHYLPTSVRFEHDGWAAGNDVYQFNFNDFFIEAGNFKIYKQTVNNNPLYNIVFKDAEDNEVGSVLYTPQNKILSSNTNTSNITSSVNPVISGLINDKQFELNYDSIENTLTTGEHNDASISLLASDFLDDYSIDIKLRDDSATINMNFSGMSLPSNEIRNGQYLVATFLEYKEDKAVWESGQYKLIVENNTFSIINAAGEPVSISPTATYGDDGSVNVSFTVNMLYTDNPQVQIQNIYPFFSDMIVDSNTAMVVQTRANQDIEFNTWNVTIYDKENTGTFNGDKLYKNNVHSDIPAEEHLDYNKQTVEQEIPLWFGVSARPGLIQDLTGLDVTTPAGTTIGTFEERYCAYGEEPATQPQSKTVYFTVKATSLVQEYSGVCLKPKSVHIWEHTVDKASDYLNDNNPTPIRITYYTKKYTWDNADPYYVKREIDGETHTITISTKWSNITAENVLGMVTSGDSTAAWVDHAVVQGNGNYIEFTANLSSCPYYKSGSLKFQFSNNGDDTDWVKISSVPVLKNQVDSFTNPKVKYNSKRDSSANAASGASYLLDDLAFWGICVKAHVATSIYISNTGMLTNSLDASYFSTTPETVDTSQYVDASGLFTHSVVQANCQNTLNINTYLVSKSTIQSMFYTSKMVLSSDNDTYFMPGHIIFGNLNKISSDFGNMSVYKINKKYTTQDYDYNYGLFFNVTGFPVKTDNDEFFSFIQDIYPVVDTQTLIAGNRFTEEVVDLFVQDEAYVISAPSFWVDIAEDSENNLLYLKDINQDVAIKLADNTVCEFTYSLQGAKLQGTGNFTYNGYTITYDTAVQSTESNQQDIEKMSVIFGVSDDYDLSFYTAKVFDNNFTLVSLRNNKVVISTVYNGIPTLLNIDFKTKQVIITQNNINIEADETWGDNNSVLLYAEDVRDIQAILCSTFVEDDNVEVLELSNTVMQVSIDDDTVSVDLLELLDSTKYSTIDYKYTRVEDKELSETKFNEVVSDNEMQFLKQQWDTTNETENFWWVDNKNILVLDKTSFILRRKTKNVTDWDGDEFIDAATWSRTDFIKSNVLKYFATSAYKNQRARFITVEDVNGTMSINIYDPLDNMSVKTLNLSIKQQPLTKEGVVLCPDNKALYTYSELLTNNVITKSKWSATCIDDFVIIGIHFDCGFNQWTAVFNLRTNTLDKVIQGYGFVGVNGCLTGGEIPSIYFNESKGFIGAVKSLDALSDRSKQIAKLNELNLDRDFVVGTDAQQWYISANISDIVSHLTYKEGNFIIEKLPLNNNYSYKYDSASYTASVFSDFELNTLALNKIMPESNALWNTLCVVWLEPILYYLAPKISVANYLQQTLGQAAYVHYNNTSIRQQKDLTKESVVNNYSKEEADKAFDEDKEASAIMSDEISFDRQSIKQVQENVTPSSNPFILFTSTLVSALDFGIEKLQVNKNQNQSAINDTGKKYTQFFLQNINSMAVADMTLQATYPTQTSEVTAIKTLDMFYSTSDTQQVQAGPGYVNHNFVAQCVAQSVTSIQSEFRQQKFCYIATPLSMWALEQVHNTLNIAINTIDKHIQSISGPDFVGLVNSISTTLKPGELILYGSILASWSIIDLGTKMLSRLLDALGGDKIKSTITARQSNHGYDIEGKHKYGSKSECFMWPCFGSQLKQTILDEGVEVVSQNKSWKIGLEVGKKRQVSTPKDIPFTTQQPNEKTRLGFNGDVPYFIAMVKGTQVKKELPYNMSYVIGTESFLPTNDFKNENISESEPVFSTPPFQDYIIDSFWQLGQTASVGMTTWISCKDTKIIDGEYSNCVISNSFCGVASPYTAIEVKKGIQKKYLRPWAVTPQALALNVTGFNCCFEEKAYHAFDGFGYRIVNWMGSAGMNKERQTWLYSFLTNDRFKRSNKMPQNEFLGNFKSDPVVAIYGDYNDKVFTLVTTPGENVGITSGTIGEDKDIRRYSLPIFSEFVNTLPAAVKTVSTQTLSVIDGITSLTTDNRDLQTAYKSPVSVDFTIGKNKYRFTQEYICSLNQQQGVTTIEQLVPCLGLTFIGSTPYEAYLYSKATRQYYVFTGGSSLKMVDMVERFYDVINGRYDFVNQEVLLPCTATFLRLDRMVKDDANITDNVIVPRLKDNTFLGEVYPPIDTIYNTRSWFRTLSLPCGITYQGPNRCIVNRFVTQDYMYNQIKNNYGNWKRVPREEYHPFREYKDKYEVVTEQIGDNLKVNGWTHNPFLLVTAPLGVNENTDCDYEWEITFCWPVEMDSLYSENNFATVNIQAETMTPGGKVIADRPAHVFLTKELFTRTNNYGYYSFRYQSRCGAGNRERLHIWSDQYICISGLQVEYKVVTEKRTEQLTQQVDVQRLNEI